MDLVYLGSALALVALALAALAALARDERAGGAR